MNTKPKQPSKIVSCQISEELFRRVDHCLQTIGCSMNAFLSQLILEQVTEIERQLQNAVVSDTSVQDTIV